MWLGWRDVTHTRSPCHQPTTFDIAVIPAPFARGHGNPASSEGVIELPIGRSRTDFRRWTTGEDARGTLRPAITEYQTLEHRGGFSFVKLSPKTGRTHQLRVHMKAVGCPILCDSRYDVATGLGFERLALHALSIKIELLGGEQKTFIAPPPDDFIAAQKIFSEI